MIEVSPNYDTEVSQRFHDTDSLAVLCARGITLVVFFFIIKIGCHIWSSAVVVETFVAHSRAD